MEVNYFLAKQLVSQKYERENPLFPFFVVALYTLLCKYSNYPEIVSDLFLKTDIFIEEDSVKNIMLHHQIEIANFYEEEEEMEHSVNATFGLSSRGNSFTFNEEGEVVPITENPFIICSLKDCDDVTLLNVFIHEMNHLVKGYIKGYDQEEENGTVGYYIRSGINFYHYRYEAESDTLYEIDCFNTLDEVINVLQTTDMMIHILTLDGIIPDKEIQDYLDTLDKEEMTEDFGYDLCVKILRPLWENETFKNSVESSLVEGNIEKILQDFDDILGEGSFEDLGDSLDDLDAMDANGEKGKKREALKRHIRGMVKQYNKKTSFSYQK